MRKSVIHLQELIAEVAKDADFEAQTRHCHVEVTIHEDCTVSGNPTLLRSAIENVVRNAIRYTREGTGVQIALNCSSSHDSAVLTVTDSGPGVPEDSIDKLFRPFYRIDDARGRHTGGVGLGLAITEGSVRLHGGSVKAKNRPEGGLIVEIEIPLTSPGSVPLEHPNPPLVAERS